MAVWPCAQIPVDAQRARRRLFPPVGTAVSAMAPELARRLVTELSVPGSLVVDVMCGTGTVLVEAALARRRAVGLDLRAECLADTLTNLQAALRAGERDRVEQLWHGDARHADDLLPDYHDRAALVVVDLPRPGAAAAQESMEGDLAPLAKTDFEAAMVEVFTAAARLLDDGGRLAVVCGHVHVRERWVDRLTPLVRAATTAGLDYIQHVIALARPIQGARFGVPLASPRPRLDELSASAAATLHTPVHDDVLVFTRPPTPPAPAPSMSSPSVEVLA